MKAKYEFKKKDEYKEYLRIYLFSKAMENILLSSAMSDEVEVVEMAEKISNSMLNKIFEKEELEQKANELSVSINKDFNKSVKVSSNKKTISELLKKSDEAFSKKDYHLALEIAQDALCLDRESKAVLSQISRCRQWIKAVDGIKELQSENASFEAVPIKKEEFTTVFPKL